ncbi:glycoside hydrolase family 5 protein [Flammeovirga sp. MY04]|uniref:glycoside hydrolase family 5 protein n=1 Tax=Flammeovirga sp. MY04 TaxID=1191459 RepID=UPI0008063E06|nr:cellulase family glycosylhydrolase [Flammeovirga sp. MY04]ANQ48994.1 glycoside hydrolase family 5 protein [Flammeovirga sp. MY04]
MSVRFTYSTFFFILCFLPFIKAQNNEAISPKEYHQLLHKGLDVDWVKSGKGMDTYSLQMLRDFKSSGLDHVRIRIKEDPTPIILHQLDRVINDCLEVGLTPIIAYHAYEFCDNADETSLQKTIDWWGTIAKHGLNYSYLVSFDLIIEVSKKLNKEPDLLNEFYERTVTRIRATNPYRIIFISPVVRSAPEKLHLLKIPSDHNDYLMAEFHFYASGPEKKNPNRLWTNGNEMEKELIRKKLDTALSWQEETGIYTWVGAWMPGNYYKGDHYSIEEQMVFAEFVTCELTKRSIPFSFNADKNYYKRENNTWLPGRKKVFDIILNTNCEK